MSEDYCELCDLPRSQCIHGNPPAPPKAPPPRSTTAPRPAAVRRVAAPARAVRHRWTPPDAFRSEILAVLEEAGGELDQDDVFTALEVRMEERLTSADHETTPEGELRWRYAARRARQGLLGEGVMTKGRPGVWALAPRG